MIIEGVDVSQHQRPEDCDWVAAAAAGLQFAYLKGSEGAGGAGAYVDPAAFDHAERLRRTRVVPGMYHFARPDNRFASSPDAIANGRAEGEHAARTAIELELVDDALPVAIDLEKYTEGVTTEQRDDFVRALVETLLSMTGRLPLVYTGPTYWGYQHSQDLAAELRDMGVLLWQVSYSDQPDPPKVIEGWPWSIWQWSGGGDFVYAEPWPGLPHPIDRNRYRGSIEEFEGLAGIAGR